MGNQRDEKTELLNQSLEKARGILAESDIVAFASLVMIDEGEQRMFDIGNGERVRVKQMIFGDYNLVANLLLASAEENKHLAQMIVRVATEVIYRGLL